MGADDYEGAPLSQDAVPYFTQHPALASRRMLLDSADLITLLTDGLARRGVPLDRLRRTRWVWVAGPDGHPQLCLIFPGLEA